MKKKYKMMIVGLLAVLVLGIGIALTASKQTKSQQPKVSTTTITNNTAKGEASEAEKQALKSSEQALSEATKKVVESANKKEEPQTNEPQQKQEAQKQQQAQQTQQTATPAPVKQAVPTNNKVVCIDAGHQRYGNSAKEPIGPGASQTKAKVTTGATGIRSHRTESQINASFNHVDILLLCVVQVKMLIFLIKNVLILRTKLMLEHSFVYIVIPQIINQSMVLLA